MRTAMRVILICLLVFLFVMIGLQSWFCFTSVKGVATVVDYSTTDVIKFSRHSGASWDETLKNALYEITVDGKTYQGTIPFFDEARGSNIDVYYQANNPQKVMTAVERWGLLVTYVVALFIVGVVYWLLYSKDKTAHLGN